MMANDIIIYKKNRASSVELKTLLLSCKFIPDLETYVEDVNVYVDKLGKHAERFEAWSDRQLVGLLACYVNNTTTREAFITMVCVLPDYSGRGIASELLKNTLQYCASQNFDSVMLEVVNNNPAALKIYERKGFVKVGTYNDMLKMKIRLKP